MSQSPAIRRVQCNNYTVGLIWLVLAEPENKGWDFPKAPEGFSSIHPCARAGACESLAGWLDFKPRF